jgi:triphosphoribosyl-dephospho-CoA synthase
LEQFALISYSKSDLQSLALALKDMGQKAEKAMFLATNGINTHKGAIFCLALSIGAVAARNIEQKTSMDSFHRTVSSMASTLAPLKSNDTHGSAVEKEYGVKGAMGQALNGYRDVLSLTLPLFYSYEKKGIDNNEANIKVLLRLMTELDDTNVLYRKGKQGYEQAKAKAAALLDNFDLAALQYLCMDFNTNNISFGGAADMLMLSLFAKELLDKGILIKD